VRRGAGNDLLALPLEGERKPREIVATVHDELLAAVSPDGRWLAYASTLTGRSEVWVRPYPGPGAPVRVSPDGGIEPAWSRNGRELFYLQENKMMAVPVWIGAQFRFDAPQELFDEQYRHVERPSYDVTSDGRFVMIQLTNAGPTAAGMVVVQNWLEEVKRRVPAGN
jgi:hypothetical protein